MRPALRSYLMGMHNPILHSASVIIAWIKLYYKLPSFKELICIIFHDIGYVQQTSINGNDDKHPELGAQLCGLFGQKYYLLCIGHSRGYADKLGIPLSKLGYADKASILVYPDWFFKIMITIGGEADEYHRTTTTRKWGYPVEVKRIKADYERWLMKNFYGIKNEGLMELEFLDFLIYGKGKDKGR